MSAQDCEQLTLFPADSPASHFPWLESKKGKTMTVTSGLRCSGLSESCSRAALSGKTFLDLFESRLRKFFPNCKSSGTKQEAIGVLFKHCIDQIERDQKEISELKAKVEQYRALIPSWVIPMTPKEG